jgi:hypothetical protein
MLLVTLGAHEREGFTLELPRDLWNLNAWPADSDRERLSGIGRASAEAFARRRTGDCR